MIQLHTVQSGGSTKRYMFYSYEHPTRGIIFENVIVLEDDDVDADADSMRKCDEFLNGIVEIVVEYTDTYVSLIPAQEQRNLYLWKEVFENFLETARVTVGLYLQAME